MQHCPVRCAAMTGPLMSSPCAVARFERSSRVVRHATNASTDATGPRCRSRECYHQIRRELETFLFGPWPSLRVESSRLLPRREKPSWRCGPTITASPARGRLRPSNYKLHPAAAASYHSVASAPPQRLRTHRRTLRRGLRSPMGNKSQLAPASKQRGLRVRRPQKRSRRSATCSA
jgi:hypothetical protein